MERENKLVKMRAARQQIILAAAKQVVLENGISERNWSEIAARSDISRQRLYSYYSNIDELLGELHTTILVQLANATRELAKDELSPQLSIRRILDSFEQYVEKYHDDLIFLTMYDAYATANMPSLDRFKKLSSIGGFNFFLESIQRGQAAGIFRTDYSGQELDYIITQIVAAVWFRFVMISTDKKSALLFDKKVTKHLYGSVFNFLEDKA